MKTEFLPEEFQCCEYCKYCDWEGQEYIGVVGEHMGPCSVQAEDLLTCGKSVVFVSPRSSCRNFSFDTNVRENIDALLDYRSPEEARTDMERYNGVRAGVDFPRSL